MLFNKTYSPDTIELLELAVERDRVTECVNRLCPAYRLPDDYQGGTPWLPDDTIDYVVILHSYLQWDNRLKRDWAIYRDCYRIQNQLSSMHPHALNQLAREWLAEHGYHKLKVV